MLVKSGLRRGATLLGTAAFWIAAWYALALAVDLVVLVPTPWQVLQRLFALVQLPLFWQSVGITLLRVCIGFVAALAAGTILAIFTTRFSLLRTLFSPLLHIIRAAPVASFIILALVWTSYDRVPIFISFLMVLPIVWINVEEGIRQTDKKLLEMTSVYRLSKMKTLKAVYFPSVKPFFLTAAVNGLSFAWKSGVAAEVICRPEFSIGKQLQEAKVDMESPDVFAWTAVVVVLSLLLERLLLKLTADARRRKEEASRVDL